MTLSLSRFDMLSDQRPCSACRLITSPHRGSGCYMGQGATVYLADDWSDKWILDTTIHGLGAVMRFYVGMADQIEITDTEDSASLKSAIRAFVSENQRQD